MNKLKPQSPVTIPTDLIHDHEHAQASSDRAIWFGFYVLKLIERIGGAEATNAELLRLLERHHVASLADELLMADVTHYSGSELYLKTEAAIAAAKYRNGLGDQLRTRVPVWRCPACEMKFYSRAEYDAHRAEESKERV